MAVKYSASNSCVNLSFPLLSHLKELEGTKKFVREFEKQDAVDLQYQMCQYNTDWVDYFAKNGLNVGNMLSHAANTTTKAVGKIFDTAGNAIDNVGDAVDNVGNSAEKTAKRSGKVISILPYIIVLVVILIIVFLYKSGAFNKVTNKLINKV